MISGTATADKAAPIATMSPELFDRLFPSSSGQHSGSNAPKPIWRSLGEDQFALACALIVAIGGASAAVGSSDMTSTRLSSVPRISPAIAPRRPESVLSPASATVSETVLVGHPDWAAAFLNQTTEARYKTLEGQVEALPEALAMEMEFNSGTISTALEFLRQARSLNWQPPEMDWHGDDAIVFSYKSGTTYKFFTLTAGQVGLLLEEDGKTTFSKGSLAFGNSVSLFSLDEVFPSTSA